MDSTLNSSRMRFNVGLNSTDFHLILEENWVSILVAESSVISLRTWPFRAESSIVIVFLPELSQTLLVAIHTDSAELKDIFPKQKERLKFKKLVSI